MGMMYEPVPKVWVVLLAAELLPPPVISGTGGMLLLPPDTHVLPTRAMTVS